jgi:hypothetical protein
MRIRKAISRRTIPIGAILAMAAATLVLTATPALAGVNPNGFNGGGDTITVAASSAFIQGNTYYVEFQTDSGCNTDTPQYTNGLSTIAVATDSGIMPVKVPAGVKVTGNGRSTPYYVCVWPIGTIGGSGTRIDVATTYTANIFKLALTNRNGPNGGNNTVTGAMTLADDSPITVPASASYPVQFQLLADHATCALTYVPGNGVTVPASNTSSNPNSPGSTLTMTVPPGTATSAPPSSIEYNVCVYNGTSTTGTGSVLIADTASSASRYKTSIYDLTLTAPGTGPSGGGNTVTATLAAGSTVAFPGTYYTQFQKSANCTADAVSTSTLNTTALSTDASTLSIPVPAGVTGATNDAYKICVYTGNTSSSAGKLLAQTGAQSYTLTAYGLSLSTYAIAKNAPNPTVTAEMNGGALPVAPASLVVEFQKDVTGTGTGACAPKYLANTAPAFLVDTASVSQVSSTKVAIAVPTAVISASPASFSICIYPGVSTTESVLTAGTATLYVIASPVAITSVNVSAGRGQGGMAIEVTGTFPAEPAPLTAAIGGEPMTNIVRTGTTKFSGKVPAHAAGTFPITVTTAAGMTVNQGVTFTYSNGISVTPQTAPGLPVETVIDIRGIGFNSLLFTDTTGVNQNSAGAHVYLVRGSYSAVSTVTPPAKTNGQVAECLAVRVVSDTELVCSLYLGGNPAGYTRSLSGCTLTVSVATLTACVPSAADVGFYVTATASGVGSGVVAPGTTILSASGTAGTLSNNQPASTGGRTGAALTLNSGREVTDVAVGTTTTVTGAVVSTLTSTTTPSTSAAPFGFGDVDKVVTATGTGVVVPAGTTIKSVSANGTAGAIATLSNSIIGSPTTVRLLHPTYNVATTGTYTVTVVANGTVGAAPTVANASIISSGSTFTVADYRRR